MTQETETHPETAGAEIKDAARATFAEAKDAAGAKAEAAKGLAGDEISRTARGLDAAADELADAPFQQDLLREAADGLKQLASAVQGKSVGALVDDVSAFGRQNPLAYLGGAALAGFALARFARAKTPEDRTASDRALPYGALTPELTGGPNDG